MRRDAYYVITEGKVQAGEFSVEREARDLAQQIIKSGKAEVGVMRCVAIAIAAVEFDDPKPKP